MRCACTVSGKDVANTRSVVSGDIMFMPILVVSNETAIVKNAEFSFDRYTFSMKFPTGFTYRNLHGFARFPGDSTALLLYSINLIILNSNRQEASS